MNHPKHLLWDRGPVSFGNLVAGSCVSWTSPDARDLLLSRCWSGVYLYRSHDLSDDELVCDPIKVCEDLEYLTRATPIDWNHDGIDELLLTDRPGFLYLARREGIYPDLTFPEASPLVDPTNGLVFNIPFTHATRDGADSQGGYLDPDFFCYAYPVVYPMAGDPGTHLLIGDAAGNLWWLRDESGGVGDVRYTGVPYEKKGPPTSYGVRYRERFGTRFVRPRHRIVDTEGDPMVFGKAFEAYRNEPGGNTKPALIRSESGSGYDLLMLSTAQCAQIELLTGSGVDDDGRPEFTRRGAVELIDVDPRTVGFHSPIIVPPHDGGESLLLHTTEGLMLLERARPSGDAPMAFRRSRIVTGTDVHAAVYGFTEVLSDRTGARYALDNPGSFRLYPIQNTADTGQPGLRLSHDYHEIEDQDGVFRPAGVTDVRTAPEWGVHRAVRYRFDAGRKDRQDLLVGTDTGHLHLMIDEGEAPFRYRRCGPVADSTGRVIKIHNRVFPAPIDYHRSGNLDVIVVGANYQMGIAPDEHAGSGWYVLRFLGLNDGIPRFADPVRVEFEGFAPEITMNQNPHLQSVDIDGDGEIELVVAVPLDDWNGRVFKVAKEGGSLVYTGTAIPQFRLHQRFLDLDGDGVLERVFAGGETGIGLYAPFEPVDLP